jgi:hypothetical protein
MGSRSYCRLVPSTRPTAQGPYFVSMTVLTSPSLSSLLRHFITRHVMSALSKTSKFTSFTGGFDDRLFELVSPPTHIYGTDSHMVGKT